MRDCCFLVADQAMGIAFERVLSRPDRDTVLGTGPFAFDPAPHVDLIQIPDYTDGGVYKHAHRILEPKLATHRHAVVCLDRKAKGLPPAGRIRGNIASNLRASGWPRERTAVIVIDPELERWLWLDHPICEQAFGYDRSSYGRSMRSMMEEQGQWRATDEKPHDCDSALAWAGRRRGRKCWPAHVFKSMLSMAPVDLCVDPAFLQLRDTLQRWFPPVR